MAVRKDQRRGSVLVAGIAGFKSGRAFQNPSAAFLRNWLEKPNFIWLVSEEILSEYKNILARLHVRRNLIGDIINLLSEEAELVEVSLTTDISPDPNDNAFCACAEQGRATFIVTLNPKDFPQSKL